MLPLLKLLGGEVFPPPSLFASVAPGEPLLNNAVSANALSFRLVRLWISFAA